MSFQSFHRQSLRWSLKGELQQKNVTSNSLVSLVSAVQCAACANSWENSQSKIFDAWTMKKYLAELWLMQDVFYHYLPASSHSHPCKIFKWTSMSRKSFQVIPCGHLNSFKASPLHLLYPPSIAAGPIPLTNSSVLLVHSIS